MATDALEGLFRDGTVLHLQRRFGMRGAAVHSAWRQALWVLAIGWVPLLLGAALQSLLLHSEGLSSFVQDRGVHCRALIAAPVLVLAKVICFPELVATCQHFLEGRVVASRDRSRFEAALISTRQLETSGWAVLGAIALAYLTIVVVTASRPEVPAWQIAYPGGWAPYSLAGWWHVGVTLPMLLVLLYGWFWRVLLWGRLLWSVSSLELNIIAAHPDHAGGLRFVGYAMRSFAPVGFAIGVIVAGSLANQVLIREVPLVDFRNAAIGAVVFVVVLFGAPPLVFMRPLQVAWQRGIHRYGSFANGLGLRFERKWLGRPAVEESALAAPDFSTLNDTYQAVGNVYAMRVVPVDVPSIVVLGVATALPILVVALTSLPLDVLGKFIRDLMF